MPALPELLETSLAWLLTYGIHSTILLLAAWLLTARVLRTDGAREIAWRTALVGGLITATGQQALGRGAMQGPAVVARTNAAPSAAGGSVEPAAAPALLPNGREIVSLPENGTPVLQSPPAAAAEPGWATGDIGPGAFSRWPEAVLVGGSVMVVLGTLALLARVILLRRHLADRRPVDDLEIVRCLRRLERDAGRRSFTRLTMSPSVRTPIAFGVLKPEICLPERASTLSRPLLETMLAHELAHVTRRDPLWLLISRLMETAFVIQPLNHLASRRLLDIAEYRSDAWAARLTGSPLGLARCLTEVAGWIRPGAPALASAMAVPTSQLEARVDRLLADTAPEQRGRRSLTLLACASCIAGVALAGPGVAPGTGEPPRGFPVEGRTSEPRAIAALDLELDLLDTELSALTRRLAAHERADQLTPLLDRMTAHEAALRARRDRLRAIEAASTPEN